MTPRKDINIIIKNRASRLSLSFTNICSQLGISRQSFYNKINGVYNWQENELPRLAEILKLDLKDLYE